MVASVTDDQLALYDCYFSSLNYVPHFGILFYLKNISEQIY